MLQQSGIEANRAEEVRGDGGFHRGQIGSIAEQLFCTHDASTVENDVKFGEALGDVVGKGLDRCGVFDIEDGSFKAGIGCGSLVEGLLAASSNDYLIAEFVKCFSECAADAGASACNDDCVAFGFHKIGPPCNSVLRHTVLILKDRISLHSIACDDRLC